MSSGVQMQNLEEEEWKRRRSSVKPRSKMVKKAAPAYKARKKTGLGDVLQDMSHSIVRYDLAVCGLAITGLLLQITVVEINHKNAYESTQLSDVLKTLVLASTCVAIVLEGMVTKTRFEYEKLTNTLLVGDTYLSSSHLTRYVVAALMLAIHAPPGVEFDIASQALSLDDTRQGWHRTTFSFDELACTLMFIRITWCFRVLYNSTGLSLESSRAISMLYSEGITRGFFVRYLVRVYPMLSVAGLSSLVLVVFSYLLMIFERRTNPSFEAYSTALWLVLVSYTTVGYGDVVPHTAAGRVLTALLCLLSLFSIALLVSSVFSKLQLTTKQHKVIHMLDHSHKQQVLKAKAAKVIGLAWKTHRKFMGSGRHIAESASLCVEIRKFREIRKELMTSSDQGTQLLFKEMISTREHSEDMFTLMDTKMTKIEARIASVDEQLDVKLKDITDILKSNLKLLKQLQ